MKSGLKHIKMVFAIMMAVAAAACSSHHYDEWEDPAAGFKTVGYMAVRLMPTDGGSRASVGDSFTAGQQSEMALSHDASHFAVLYGDGDETPLAVCDLNGMGSSMSTDTEANSSMVYATIIARDELKEVLMKYRDCYVVLNTGLTIEALQRYKRNELIEMRTTSPYFYDKKGERYFTMCSSVYVENGQKKIHTEVDTDKIYQSYQETIEQAWKGNAAVTAYVERLAARFTLRFDNEAFNAPDADRVFVPNLNNIVLYSGLTDGGVPLYKDKDEATGIPLTYKVRITGWGLNALERELYLFRHFDANGGYFTNWFNSAYKRAYWSVDYNYGNAVYPLQYRKVIDNSGIPVYQNANNILLNLPYDELNADGFMPRYKYAPENTFDFTDAQLSAALEGKPELLAGTHLIVCAEVLSNIEDPTVWGPHEILRDRNGSFYRDERDCAKALVTIMNNHLKTHASLKFTFWDWTLGGVEYKLFAKTKGEYSLYYGTRRLDAKYVDELYDQGVSLLAVAEFKGSDGKRVLWNDNFKILDDKGNPLQTYSNIDEVNSKNDVWLRESTVNDLKSVIFEHVGAVDHFNDGKMYYAVPIGYISDGRSVEGQSDTYSIYGVVRNSTYDILIKSVSGLGAAVDDPDQPIVPNDATTSDHLFIGFDILDWHEIDQTVPGAIS